MAKTITKSAPAKLNLFLEIQGKRPDGFHEIETVMQRISLADEVELTPGGDGIRLICNRKELETPDNLVVRAADLFREKTGVREGVAIRLEKRVPVGGGFGGGSSDAAAVLSGLEECWRTGISRADLLALARQLGSDVPFFLGESSLALATGRGEILHPLPPCPATLHFVVGFPDFSLSTKEVYAKVKSVLKRPFQSATIMVCALGRGNMSEIGRTLFNRLEQAALLVNSEIDSAKKSFTHQLFLGRLMTGSGSGLFGLVPSRKEAELAFQALKARGWKNVWCVSSR